MTEEEWLGYKFPCHRLTHLAQISTERKLRLYAVACCQRVSSFFPDQRCLRAIDWAERLAEGHLSEAERTQAVQEALEVFLPLGAAADAVYRGTWTALDLLSDDERDRYEPIYHQAYAQAQQDGLDPNLAWEARSASQAAYQILNADRWTFLAAADFAAKAVKYACTPDIWEAYSTGPDEGENAAQLKLLEDIFGNPFRPVEFASSWSTPIVTRLAAAIYKDRTFDRLPILADALEEAGCTNADVLAHCRGPGPHVRGCWVIDRLTGRE